jgi:hypothetical protein
MAYTGEYTQRDGTVIESELLEKVRELEAKVATLQEQNKTLQEGSPSLETIGDASLLKTVETRLEGKIEAAMEACTHKVTEKVNARLNEAIQMFESHIKAKREEENTKRVQTNPPPPTK